MQKQPLVSIIMATYNGLDHLRLCLPTLFNSAYSNFELILVDNNSIDETAEFVKKNYPKVKYIKKDKNHGFAEGNNIGLEFVKGDYILFLSNDTKVEKNFITEMILLLENRKELGGVQSKVFLMDDPKLLDSVGSFLTNTGFLYHYGANKKDAPQYNKDIYIYSAKGVCMMFRKKVIEKILVNGEIFDSTYFAYFEETDMCHRVWLAGYKIGYAQKSIIYHKVGGTSKRMNNAFIQFHSFKNRINSYLKNLSFANLLLILPLHLLLCEMNAMYYILRGNPAMFFAIHRAIIWNVTQFGNTWKKRELVQKNIRVVTDKSIFPYILRNVGVDYYLNLFSGLREYREKPIISSVNKHG